MLKIFNTLGRELQEFKPIEEGKVKMYQCGPTVYSRQHIGNLFSATKGDMIRRSLSYMGYNVDYVRNITDVGHLVSDEDEGEDKVAKGAKREGLTPEEITKKYTDIYHDDLKLLNVLNPTYETPATEYINQMAEMVQNLLDKGFAYARSQAIYFEVNKFPEYTKLSGQKLEMNEQGAGHGDVSDNEKKSPFDFAVWFFKTGVHENALQTWEYKFNGIEQPILSGFPGWHIECSAMSKDRLGDTIDIHMGGIEHIPVHHTNEIAQSEASNGKKFVNYWLHHEMLEVDGGKMAKSIGNVYTTDDIKEKGFDILSYRYFLMQAHYRSKQNFTWEAVRGAETAYKKLIENLKNFKGQNGEVAENFKNQFIKALEEDFNIPKALSIVWEVIKSDIEPQNKFATILDFDKVLGLSLEEKISEEKEISEEAKKLIEEREEARKNKDWAKSDELRDRLKSEFGIELKDK